MRVKTFETNELQRAAWEGSLERLREILSDCESPDETMEEGGGSGRETYTALMLAAERGHSECVRELLSRGADPMHETKRGETALILAVRKERIECVKELEKVSDVKHKDKEGVSAFWRAVSLRSVELVELLMQKADVEEKKDGRTALGWAACFKEKKIFDLLLPVSNLRSVDANGLTALMHAAWNGRVDFIEALLKIDEDRVSDKDDNGWTALAYSAHEGHLPAVRNLAETSNIMEKNIHGESAEDLARFNGHEEVCEFLRAKREEGLLREESRETNLKRTQRKI